MKKMHKLLIAAALLLALGFGALTGLGGSTPLARLTGSVPVAHADGGDNWPPPGGLDCPEPTPTPTPPSH